MYFASVYTSSCPFLSRLSGEEWLLTHEEVETYIPEVGEKVTKEVQTTVLGRTQFCVVVNPHNEDGLQVGSQIIFYISTRNFQKLKENIVEVKYLIG